MTEASPSAVSGQVARQSRWPVLRSLQGYRPAFATHDLVAGFTLVAIAIPEPMARRLAVSTRWYLRLFGWLIWFMDQSSNVLLRAVKIEPVHDVEQAATARDLEHIVAASSASGEMRRDLSTLLGRFGLRAQLGQRDPLPRPAQAMLTATATRKLGGHTARRQRRQTQDQGPGERGAAGGVARFGRGVGRRRDGPRRNRQLNSRPDRTRRGWAGSTLPA